MKPTLGKQSRMSTTASFSLLLPSTILWLEKEKSKLSSTPQANFGISACSTASSFAMGRWACLKEAGCNCVANAFPLHQQDLRNIKILAPLWIGYCSARSETRVPADASNAQSCGHEAFGEHSPRDGTHDLRPLHTPLHHCWAIQCAYMRSQISSASPDQDILSPDNCWNYVSNI